MRHVPLLPLIPLLVACAAGENAPLRDLQAWDSATPSTRRRLAENAGRSRGFALLRLERFECAGVTHEVAIYVHETTALEFVLIPGSATSAEQCAPFLIARTECTQPAYARVMRQTPETDSSANCAVESVSWADADRFCKAAGLRLPTETEWRHACLAGASAPWAFGSDRSKLHQYAWFNEHYPEASSRPAGLAVQLKLPNSLGLFDMHGGLWEWLESPRSARTRSFAGGSWREHADNTRFDVTAGTNPEVDGTYPFRG